MTEDAGKTWLRGSSIRMPYLAAQEWCEGERYGVSLVGGQDFGERVGIYRSFDFGRTAQCPYTPAPSWWPNAPRGFWSFAPVSAR